MANYAPIQDLGVVQIQTTDNFVAVEPGLAGVAYLNPSTAIGLQSYTNLDAVECDYPQGSYIYNAANGYFSNTESPLFQVINYTSNALSSASSSTPSAAGSSAGSSSAGSASAGSSAPIINVPSTTSEDVTNAIAAVTKYFGAAWEHLVIHVTSTNHDVAIEVAKFVEAQNNKLVYLEVPADAPANGVGPDFSWLSPLLPNSATDYAGTLSTTVQSNPEATANDADYNLDGAFLGSFANATLGSNPQFTIGLENVGTFKVQDQYNFVKADNDKYYTPYNVWTYAYRNGTPMFTSEFSVAGYQIKPMLVRDAIIADVKKAIVNLFLQNDGIQFNEAGVRMITDQIQLVLDSMTKQGLITNAKVNTVDVDKIADTVKATGHLSGLGWEWSPVWGIDSVKFKQAIDLPELH